MSVMIFSALNNSLNVACREMLHPDSHILNETCIVWDNGGHFIVLSHIICR